MNFHQMQADAYRYEAKRLRTELEATTRASRRRWLLQRIGRLIDRAHWHARRVAEPVPSSVRRRVRTAVHWRGVAARAATINERNDALCRAAKALKAAGHEYARLRERTKHNATDMVSVARVECNGTVETKARVSEQSQ